MLGDLSYEYDAAGRRAKMGGSYARQSLPPALTTATHNDANQLTQRGAATLAYDDQGNLTNDGVNTYSLFFDGDYFCRKYSKVDRQR